MIYGEFISAIVNIGMDNVDVLTERAKDGADAMTVITRITLHAAVEKLSPEQRVEVVELVRRRVLDPGSV